MQELKDPKKRNTALGEVDEDGVKGMFKKAAPALSKALKPKSELEESNLKVRLANAGFSTPNAPTFFLAIKFAGLVIGMAFGGGYGAMSYGMTQSGIFSLVIGGGLGFYLPELALTLVRMGRMERVFLALPDALDLLVVCVESGLGLDAAMRKVADEMNDSAPDVCSEFHLCNMQLQMGPCFILGWVAGALRRKPPCENACDSGGFRFAVRPRHPTADDRVVVVDDVVTTGGSSLLAVDRIQEFGGNVVCVVGIVDRMEGGAENFAARDLPFKSLLTIEDFGITRPSN